MKDFMKLCLMFFLTVLISACNSQQEVSESNNSSEDFPRQPVTYSIPFMPGGQSDIDARRQIPYLEEALEQNVRVDYKEGAGGAIGWTDLVNQPPDGHFMSGINVPHIIMQPMVNEDTGYETEEIEPVFLFQRTPIGIAVHKDSGIETLDEFLKLVQEDSVTVSISGTYSGTHLLALDMEAETGLDIITVPSAGAAETIQYVLGGTTTAVFANSTDLINYKDEFNILAIGSEERFEPLPDVPTFKELGIDITGSIERGVAVPPGTSEEEIKTLENAFQQILSKPEVQEEMINEGFEPLEMGVDESQEFIDEKYSEIENRLRTLGEIE